MRRGGLVRRGDTRRAGKVALISIALVLSAGVAGADANPLSEIPWLVRSLDGLARDAVRGVLGRHSKTEVARNDRGSVSGPFTEKREIDSLHPTGATPVVSISAVFTNLTIDTWNERLVRVQAEITAEASGADQAKQLAESISVTTQAAENLVEIRVNVPTVAHIPGGAAGVVGRITVPRQASVILENQFGDVRVEGVDGMLGLDVSFGAVTLNRIGGEIRARSLGEMAFSGTDLARGGTFELKGVRAELRRVSGTIKLSNFGGSVRVEEPGETLNAELTVDGGEIVLLLDPARPGDIGISGVCSSLESVIPLDRSEQGDRLVARRAQPDSDVRWSVNASFSRIQIAESVAAGPLPVAMTGLTPPVTDTVNQAAAVPPMPLIMVELAPGDLMIEPGGEGEVSAMLTRSVQGLQADTATVILDAIRLDIEPVENGLKIRTSGPEASLVGPLAQWRADVVLRVPQDATLDINASDGHLTVAALERPVRIRLGRGEVRVTRCTAPVEMDIIAGDVRITECAGPIKITAEQGNLRLERIGGPIAVNTGTGNILIDAPRNAVRVETDSGEVRMLALDPLAGDVIIRGGKGRVTLVIAPESSANITLRAMGGRVDSRIPLTGFIDRDRQEFTGKLGDGAFTLLVETRGGNITLN